MNTPDPILWLPGPTQVDPHVLQALTGPVIGHRGPEIQELVAEAERRLQWLLQTRQPVILSTSSATAVMEAAIVNTVGSRGVLHLVCGAFSKKWYEISCSLGKPADRLDVDWGQGFTPAQVAEALAGKDYDAVCLTHNETSTGVMNPLREIAEVVAAQPDTLLLVDAVSSMAAVQIPFDEWQIDVLLAGVQKALALPPGLAVAALSARTIARAEKQPHRGTYLDFLSHLKFLEKHQTPTTPSTPHLYALCLQLERIENEGLAPREERHRTMAKTSQDWARQHFQLFAAEEFLSPTVTCIHLEDPDPRELVKSLRQEGIILGSGYGKLKPTTFRIGHMGEHNSTELHTLLQSIEQRLALKE